MASEAQIKRTIKLKENLLSSSYELCIERARFFTEIYKNNENIPEIIKKAKAIDHTLKKMTIFIRDDEMLVGHETSKNLGEKTIKMVYKKSKEDYTKIVKTTLKERNNFVLNNNELHELAKYVALIEDYYKKPMDIEWAKDGLTGKLYIVQARPETVKSQAKKQIITRYHLEFLLYLDLFLLQYFFP